MSESPTKTETGTPASDEGTPNSAQPNDGVDGSKEQPKETPKPNDKGADDIGATKPKTEEGKTGERIVPEKYDLKIPDGAEIDPAHVEKISSYAKEKGLTNEEAQGILSRDAELISSFKNGQREQLAKASSEWIESSKSDKEIGGEAFTRNVELAKRVIDRFGTDEFKKALDDTSLGNHPELVRLLVRIGKGMAEDQFIPAGSQSGGKRSAVDILYGNPTENKGE